MMILKKNKIKIKILVQDLNIENVHILKNIIEESLNPLNPLINNKETKLSKINEMNLNEEIANSLLVISKELLKIRLMLLNKN